MVRVELSETALADFAAVPLGMKGRVMAVIERLEKWPSVSGAKPLTHNLKGHYRVRTGDWRVIFHLNRNVLMIDRIDNRKDVYR